MVIVPLLHVHVYVCLYWLYWNQFILQHCIPIPNLSQIGRNPLCWQDSWLYCNVGIWISHCSFNCYIFVNILFLGDALTTTVVYVWSHCNLYLCVLHVLQSLHLPSSVSLTDPSPSGNPLECGSIIGNLHVVRTAAGWFYCFLLVELIVSP